MVTTTGAVSSVRTKPTLTTKPRVCLYLLATDVVCLIKLSALTFAEMFESGRCAGDYGAFD